MTSSILPNAQGFALRGYIAGLTLSTAGASATFSVAPGDAADSTNAIIIRLPSSISKTTAAWAVGTGNGALDTGAIANSTWYHVLLIRRPDTGVVDVLISLSATAPTLPTNYTQFRRIGSMKTNGSGQWTLFHQNGDEFLWDVQTTDVNGLASSAGSQTVTLNVPTGVQVNALGSFRTDFGTAQCACYLSSLDMTAPTSGGVVTMALSGTTGSLPACLETNIRTNTSGQIRITGNATGSTYSMTTFGWIDTRGRFS